MHYADFLQKLLPPDTLPFDVSQVEEVEENCGTTWITLKDGSTYALTIQQCETEDQPPNLLQEFERQFPHDFTE